MEGVALNSGEFNRLVEEIMDEVLGLGPLEPLLKDDTINDVLVNTHAQVFVERGGQLELTSARFKDDAHLLRIIDKIVSRVGHPLSSALTTVAEELPDPAGSETGIVVDEITYGLSLRHAIENMRDRVPADDLHYFAVALQIQHGTGGNLAEVLQGLSKLIRERLQFFRKVRAVTGHARMASIFASLFPLIIPVGLNWIMPDFYGAVSDRPWFPWVIGGGVFMCFMNYLVMRWMVVVKV